MVAGRAEITHQAGSTSIYLGVNMFGERSQQTPNEHTRAKKNENLKTCFDTRQDMRAFTRTRQQGGTRYTLFVNTYIYHGMTSYSKRGVGVLVNVLCVWPCLECNLLEFEVDKT